MIIEYFEYVKSEYPIKQLRTIIIAIYKSYDPDKKHDNIDCVCLQHIYLLLSFITYCICIMKLNAKICGVSSFFFGAVAAIDFAANQPALVTLGLAWGSGAMFMTAIDKLTSTKVPRRPEKDAQNGPTPKPL